MEIQCQFCGETVPLGSAKCPHCGAAMPEPAGDIPMSPKVPEAPAAFRCPNCGSVMDLDALRCPHCGFEGEGVPARRRASTAEKVLLGVLFVLVGVPAGLLGACTGMLGASYGGKGGLDLATWVGLAALGIGVFALLLWLWIRSLKR